MGMEKGIKVGFAQRSQSRSRIHRVRSASNLLLQMSATERTSLAKSSSEQPTYVEYTGLLRTHRSRLRQFQCCICATLLVILIMALVTTVSYSLKGDSDESVASNTTNRLNLSLSGPSTSFAALSQNEWSEAMQAGSQAIKTRHLADDSATLLPRDPSPDSRHRSAVKTSIHAGTLALAAVGELAATQHVQESRQRVGENRTAVGAFFDGQWAPLGSCKHQLGCAPTKYRTYDGSCNHPQNHGASFTQYSRSLPPSYADGLSAPRVAKSGRALPPVRQISLRVHRPSPSANPSFTVMLAVFGQFIDHDITATAISQGRNGSSLACCSSKSRHPECYPVMLQPGDPAFDIANQRCMEFVRSAPAIQCKIGPRQQLNQVTAFIDGSTIYGSDEATAQSLREKKSGLLRMFKAPNGRFLLPQSTDPNDGCNREIESKRGRYCFASGDARANENLHLTTLHLLWARQHNAIARRLAELNPSWDDEKLYQESRRIVGAQLQHIMYNEFLPIVLGETEMTRRNLSGLTGGYRSYSASQEDPAIANNFAAAAFRFAHTLLPGLMRMTDAQNGTEAYVELHRMLFNPYSLYDHDGVDQAINSATSNVIQRTSTHVTSQLTRHLFEDPLQDTVRIPCGLDLVSLNIQRARDHGLPGYAAWREHCGLERPRDFQELREIVDAESWDEIRKLYEDVDDIDLYTGALAEVPPDGLVGPTFSCLIAEQFQRLQLGDRFWYENSDQPHPFTEEQLAQLRKSTLARLICDCSEGITRIQPKIMRTIDLTNPVTLCDDIPSMDLSVFQENLNSNH